MALKFRNIDTDPADPVETWGSEGVLTALDRCDLTDWSRVLRVVEADPWAKSFNSLKSRPSEPRTAVLARGPNSRLRVFAKRTGTSASRLSTYLAAKTCPSAAYMVRSRRVAAFASLRFRTSKTK